jgi:gamma-D-glutamyl-L-lysine dipeptidyl-peptidase
MMEKFLIVTTPVADIRRKPVDAKPQYVHDDLQETQALYDEVLLYKDETEDWYYVEVIEQQKIVREDAFQGYPGWVRKKSVAAIDSPPKYNGIVREKTAVVRRDPSEKGEVLIAVPIGTRLVIGESNHPTHYQVVRADGQAGWVKKRDVNILGYRPSESTLRKSIIGAAKLFLGAPYLWGGRSMYMPELAGKAAEPLLRRDRSRVQGAEAEVIRLNTQHAHPDEGGATLNTVLTGVDCSGLTNLVFRVNDINIPRDAHDQWLAAEKIGHERLKAGDLIFMSEKDTPASIVHVLLSAGGEEFFEAEETGSVVSLTDFSDKFEIDLGHLVEQGFNVNGSQITFGRMIPHDE